MQTSEAVFMMIRRCIPLVLGSAIGAGSILLSGQARAADLAPPIVSSDAIAVLNPSLIPAKNSQPFSGAAPTKSIDRPIVIPAVSRLLPASTAALLLMNPDEQVWQSLAQFKSFPRDMTTPGGLFSGTFEGLSYHGDIAPWLGGPIGIAMILDSDRTTYYATIAPVQDATQMPKFLSRLKRTRGKLPVMRTHNGVSILYWEPEKYADVLSASRSDLESPDAEAESATIEPGTLQKPEVKPEVKPDSKPKPKPAPKMIEYGGYAIAYLPSGYVVSSEKLKAVEQLIDAQTGTDKLADVPAFQRMLQDDRYPKSLLAAYADYGLFVQSDVMRASNRAAQLPFSWASPEAQAGIKLIQSVQDRIDGFVWVQPEGLQVQASLHLKQPLPIAMAGLFKSPNALPSRMPAVTYSMSNGSDLAAFWQLAVKGIEFVPKFKKDLESFRTSSQKTFGVDDRDIFPWMNQEYAVFGYPSRTGIFPKFEPKLELGLGAIFQTTQRPAATTALKKIETALTKVSGGQMKVVPRVVLGQSLTSWDMPGFKDKNPVSVVAYQWASPDTLMLFSGADASANLLPNPQTSLAQSANFKAAIAPLPSENMGYSYFNPPAMLALANRFGYSDWFKTPGAPSDPEMDVSTIVNSVFSVASTSAVQGTQISSDGFAKLATRPLPKLTAQDFLERAQLKLGTDNDWAIANFTRSIALDPKQTDAYYGRATAKHSARDFRGAIEDFDRTLELEPKKIDALRFRAEAKRENYDYAGTIADVSRALDLKPDSDTLTSLYHERATALIAQSSYTDALKDLDQARQNDSTAMRTLDLQCAASARSARPDALKICEDAIATHMPPDVPFRKGASAIAVNSSIQSALFIPATLSAHRCLARVQQKDSKAFKDCGAAITAEPDNPLVYELEGQARLDSGDRRGAVLSLEKALKIYQLLEDPTAIDRTQALLKQAKL